jgi:DNA-binding response OmpR family regulator
MTSELGRFRRRLRCRIVAERTVLVVEDERAIADAVGARLRAEGFLVETAFDGPTAVELNRRARPDVVVLDVMLPGFDGLEVCRQIQSEPGSTPMVLMLTARDAETDVIVGLGVGADDYMTKPFSARVLVARVKALVRRIERAAAVPAGEAKILAEGLEIDPAGRRVVVGGDEVHLTPTEFDLLLHLARSPGVVFSRERLLMEVWGYADGSGERTVDTHIAGLRRKVGSQWIRTAHGVGYAFEPR